VISDVIRVGVVSVALLHAPLCAAEAVTVFFSTHQVGGFGYMLRRPWFIDGTAFVQIRGDERVTVDLPAGKHVIRGNSTSSSLTFDVKSRMVIKFTDTGFAEVLVDQDPIVKQELADTKPVEPDAFRPRPKGSGFVSDERAGK
jgi:predicted naringenin-chalcone synthase